LLRDLKDALTLPVSKAENECDGKRSSLSSFVTAGLVSAIHALLATAPKDVDARHPSTPRLRRIQRQSAEALAKAGTRQGMTSSDIVAETLSTQDGWS
jgi:hypothetical protein